MVTKKCEGKIHGQTRESRNCKVYQLKLSDYKITEERPYKEGRVTKWVKAVKVGNKDEQFAFKIISEDKNSVRNQVTILKELHGFQNIIKIYGLTCDDVKWYLVPNTT